MVYSQTNCWDGLQDGDPNALAFIYDTFADKLFEAAVRLSRDRELAKDTLQEVFLNTWSYRHNFAAVQNPQAYLFSILRHTLARKLKSSAPVIADAAMDGLPSFEENAEEKRIGQDTEQENAVRLQLACNQLTTRQREVIKMRFYEGRTHKQIATILRMNYQSVNNLLFRALGNLKKEF